MPLSPQAQAVVQALTDLYEVILRMSNRPFTDLQRAPSEGHTLPAKLQAALAQHKAPQVIELIKHLPFARFVHLAPDSTPTDYLHETSTNYWIHQAWRPVQFGLETGDDDEALVLPEELPMTEQIEQFGDIFIIDTRDWSARIHPSVLGNRNNCNIHSAPGAGECPLVCRGRKDIQTGFAVDMLRKWKEKFIECTWVIDRMPPDIITAEDPPQEEYFEKLQETYVVHGWPDNFRASECRDVLGSLPNSDDDYWVFGSEDDSHEDDEQT